MTQRSTEIIKAVFQLLHNTSLETDAFARATGLHCKSGCGKCCDNPKIETTITEMLPLAAHLCATGQAKDILSYADEQDVCVAYQPDSVVKGNGRCRYYDYRPGICRLFGYAVKRDVKDGSRQLITCRIIKEEFKQDYQQALKHIEDNRPVALTNDYAMKVFAIDPIDGRVLLPINQALKKAIEIAWQKPHFP